MKKILFISQLGYHTPSSYIGGLIYKDMLIKDGYKVSYACYNSPLIDSLINSPSKYSQVLFNFGFRFLLISLQRLVVAIKKQYLITIAKQYSIICLLKIQSEVFVKGLKKATKARVILYFGDAIWYSNKNFKGLNITICY